MKETLFQRKGVFNPLLISLNGLHSIQTGFINKIETGPQKEG